MALYEMTSGELTPVPASTFAVEGVLERTDLQSALREHIDVLGEDLLVVAEEFGDFDVNRRIDLLCIDRTGRLVVIELKRTEGGGHVELQALRYAAMVSAMTFDQLVDTYRRHLTRLASPDADNAHSLLLEWLAGVEAPDILDRRVRIILASAGFDTQITTTVLWLNELFGLDISCVRLTPYRVAGKLLLDVQHVIPLPEAAEFTVGVRRREDAARAAQAGGSGADWTRYVVTSPSTVSAPLFKRRAILAMVLALHESGVPASVMADALPGWPRLLPVATPPGDSELRSAFGEAYPKHQNSLDRWFLDAPIQDTDGNTWVLSKMWGLDTEDALDALVTLAPVPGFGYEPRI